MRRSPILSPARQSRRSAFADDSDSEGAASEDAPSYRSNYSGAGTQMSSAGSQRASSLLKYLDDVVEDSVHSSAPPYSGRPLSSSRIRDDLSTISASPSIAASRHSTVSRRTYIWDEEDPKEHMSLSGPTYFTIEDSGRSIGGSVAKSQLTEKVNELKSKISAMKTELSARNDQAKQMQNDFARVKAARSRQEQKVTAVWENRLQSILGEQNDTKKLQIALIEKIEKDIKKLREKESALEEKMKKVEQSKETAIENARNEAKRLRKKAIRQLEADEAQSTSKLIASRVDAMHKSAAQALAPELENVVKEGKDRLHNREREADAARVALAESLRKEADKTFLEFQALCRERYSSSDVDRRANLIGETKLEEARARHESERAALMQRQARDRRALEEEFEASRKSIVESHRAMQISISDSHAQKVKDVSSLHSKELSSLVQRLSDERAELCARLDHEREEYSRRRRAEAAELRSAIERARKEEEARAVEMGLSDILLKLKEASYLLSCWFSSAHCICRR
jgi:hypothetical protein